MRSTPIPTACVLLSDGLLDHISGIVAFQSGSLKADNLEFNVVATKL
jgi:hypothetical protein